MRRLKPGPIGAPSFTVATASDPVTLELSPRYARIPDVEFTWYDDAEDQRSSAERWDWFAAYMAERQARNLDVTHCMTKCLRRYYGKNAARFAAKGSSWRGDVWE